MLNNRYIRIKSVVSVVNVVSDLPNFFFFLYKLGK